MNCNRIDIAYGETGFYSGIILDYLDGNEKLKPFFKHPLSGEGIKEAIRVRKSFATDRKLLVEVLQKHYSGENPAAQQQINIQQLGDPNCFTITTAHQPNIFTGHLYFIYKILHTIRLCEKLKVDMPENNFVPVFYMGSEDADLDELGHVVINGIKHEWKTNQTGAVGRMMIDKALIKILEDIEGEIAVLPYGLEIIEKLRSCYIIGTTIEMATFKLVNRLFGEYGLIVLLPDNPDYKKVFVPVVEKELKDQFSFKIVDETVAKFPKAYKVQASGRDLNMFYLKDDIRERILKEDSTATSQASRFNIQNSELAFDESGILDELKQFPERFSPNVILRPVFQEMILPNIAFVGGGGELAYWLELKNVFAAVNVPYPVLVLRNSFMLVKKEQAVKATKLGFTTKDLFRSEHDLMNELVNRETKVSLSLDKEKKEIQNFYGGLKNKAAAVDITLQRHSESLEKQAIKKIEALEKKMLRAEKRKFEAQQRQLKKLKSQLFPNDNLQERVENMMTFYAIWGKEFLKEVFNNAGGLLDEFVILELE